MAGIISNSNSNSNSRMEMWVQDGQIYLKTPEAENAVVTPRTLLQEIQKYFFIDFGIQPLKTIRSREVKGDICPYCGSTETIGHGSRTTQTELQIRRWCNSCNRTFVAGKESIKEISTKKNKGTKGIVKFLYLLEFSRQEIAERLNISWSIVNTYVKEQELEYLQEYYLKNEANTMASGGHEGISTAPEFVLHNRFKDTIGDTYIWDYNGRVALQSKSRKLNGTTAFLYKNDLKAMLALSKTKVRSFLKDIPAEECEIILNYIEDKKDDMMGILPKTHIFTKVADDGGEIDADLMESAAHRDVEESSSE